MKKWKTLLLTCGLLSLPSLSFSATDEEVYRLLQQLMSEVQELKQENQYLKKEIERLKSQQEKEIKEVKTEIAKNTKKEESGISSGFFSKGAYGAGKSKVDFYGFIKGDLIWQDSTSVGTVYLLWTLPKKPRRT